jgi:hypothetical protein
MWAPPESDPAWDALAQLVQGLNLAANRLAAPEEPVPPGEGPAADAGDEGEGFLRFIDLLKQLQTLHAAALPEAGAPLARPEEIPTPLPAGAAAGQAGAWATQAGAEAGYWLKQLLGLLRAAGGPAPAATGATAVDPRAIMAQNPEGAAQSGVRFGQGWEPLPQERQPAEGLFSAASSGVGSEAAAENSAGARRDGALPIDSLNALLARLRSGEGAGAAEAGEVPAPLREGLTPTPPAGERPSATHLPGRMPQWLAQAHEALSAIPWGRLAQLTAGQGAAAESAAPEALAEENGRPAAESAAPELMPPALPGALREAQGRGRAAEAARGFTDPGAAAPRPSSAEPCPDAAAEAARPPAGPRVSAQRHPEAEAASPASAREAPRAEPMPLSNETGRAPVADPSAPSAIAVADGSDDGLSAAILRDLRTAPHPEPTAEKQAGVEAGPKHREADGAAAKGNVVEQIVQRAAVHLKSDQSEARIDLKPEFLGHVRMQIVTENQQVTVRILTELPMVRDLIEQSLPQLKSDLQQQGLQVERVEVSVADDPRRDAGRQHRAGGRRNGRGPDGPGTAEVGAVAARVQELASYWGQSGRTTINMFV